MDTIIVNNKIFNKNINSFILKHEEICFMILMIFLAFILHILHIGCIARFLTGVSCPGCGMTRAMIHVAKLDFKTAIYYHPLVFTMPILGILFIYKNKINVIVLNTILMFILILFLLVYILRLIDVNNDVVYIDITKSFFYKILTYYKNK